MQQNMRPITKPDLNTIFESMLSIPANVRAQHVNAYLLTGTPEQKLAAAMIKDMPQSQAPAAPAQAPTQTVIDQKLAQVDPGIASLPVAEGMFDGGSYAGGGIIAFDEGGDVPSYAGPRGSYVVGPDPNELMQSYSSNLAGEEQRYAADRPEFGLGQIGAWAQHKNALAKLKQSAKTPYDPAIQYYDSIGNLQGKMMAQKERANWLENPTNLMENAVSETPAKPLAALPPAAAPSVAKPAGDRPASAIQTPNVSGIKALEFKPLEDKGAMFDELKQTVKTPKEYMQEREELIGADPNRPAIDAKLKAMEEKTAKAEANAGPMAGIVFGLGLMKARKGQVGQAITEAGLKAVDEYTTAQNRAESAREKQFDISSRLATADRAAKIAAADHGINSERAISAENRAVQLAKTKSAIDTEAKNAEGEFNAQKGNAEIALKKAEMAQKAAIEAATLRVQEKLIDSKAGLAGGMDRKEIGDALINLKQDPAYTAYSAEMLKKYGKNAASQKAFQSAMDAKLQELFQNYYGGGGFKVVGVR